MAVALRIMNKYYLVFLLLPVLLAACDAAGPPAESVALTTTVAKPATEAVPDAELRELDWDSLIPPDWSPEKLMADYNADDLADNDPRAIELMGKLRELWDKAPVVQELDGQAVRLPGFIVPLETVDRKVSEFLLVPYYGACVHVPPPPANQTVYVVVEQGKAKPHALFDTVWVSGTLSVKHVSSEAGESGYTIYASDVSPYEE